MICVSIQKTGFEETVRILSSPVTEMAELRLDLSDYGTEEVTRLCSMPVPVIATCRCGISGEAKADRQLSAAIQAGAAFVDIELGMQQRAQIIHIFPTDMAFVWTRMHRNAVCAKSFTIQRHLHHVRHIASTGIPQGCNLIDIHA